MMLVLIGNESFLYGLLPEQKMITAFGCVKSREAEHA